LAVRLKVLPFSEAESLTRCSLATQIVFAFIDDELGIISGQSPVFSRPNSSTDDRLSEVTAKSPDKELHGALW